ncbi:MAG: hypothetical protein HYT81_05095 [Gemmatimonadetes bacterium]|nr:hypothetical protein [Gemmatimonadota bacterium]
MRLNTWYEAGLVAGIALVSACGGETLEPLPSKFQAVVAGGVHSCGLVEDGQAFCWGNNVYGQLGDGSTKSHVYPVPVVGSGRYVAVSGGGGHTCAIATTGAAHCWGYTFNGQLGDGTQGNDVGRATPAPVAGNLRWVSLSAGGAYTCGIATDSLAYCWGWNADGQLGDGSNTDRPVPTAVSGGLRFRSISANNRHTCGLTFAGDAYCWGSNQYGQLGTADTEGSNTPRLVSGGGVWTVVDAGFSHSCGMAAGGSGFCWGRNHFGQLGLSDTVGGGDQTGPVPVAGEITWGSLDMGAYFSCGVEAQTEAAYCWGYNGSGQLGGNVPDTCAEEGGTVSQCALSPVAVTGGLSFVSVSAHTQHVCGLSVDGVAYCWGLGSDGQLGDGRKGSGTFAIEPVKVAGQP